MSDSFFVTFGINLGNSSI